MLDGAVSQLKSEAKPAKAKDWRSDWNLFKVSKAKFKISEPLGISRGLNYIEHKPKRYDSRRYEWSVSGMNEQIFDLTGGEKFNSLGFCKLFKLSNFVSKVQFQL